MGQWYSLEHEDRENWQARFPWRRKRKLAVNFLTGFLSCGPGLMHLVERIQIEG
jgi:hypothetical protein